MEHGADMDQIQIKNMEIYCRHGVLPEENVLGQKFLVSLTFYLDVRRAGREDDLNESVDYAAAAHFVKERMEEKTYQLIEAAAEHLAAEALKRFPAVKEVAVEIKKPWAPIPIPMETVGVSIRRGWTEAYLSVGANMGDRRANIEAALGRLAEDEGIRRLQASELIETEPYGYTDQPDFLNGAVRLETLYSPEELLRCLHEVERLGGRERTVRWGPRTIDLDILLYGDRMMCTETLTIPHRDMHRREFVLRPLCELAPWLIHPGLHRTMLELLQELEEKEGQRKENEDD